MPNPCPSWCSLSAGHPYRNELDSPDGDPFRAHQRLVGRHGRVRVQVESYETRLRGWRSTSSPAGVTVYLDHGAGDSALDDLTPAEARGLAGLLLAAADAIEGRR